MSTSKSRILRLSAQRPTFKYDVKQLAVEFSKTLRIWLKPMDMVRVVERNNDDGDPRVCHSHDFCDANMAMGAAFENVFGRPWNDESDMDEAIWAFAWDVAKECEFDVDAIRRQ